MSKAEINWYEVAQRKQKRIEDLEARLDACERKARGGLSGLANEIDQLVYERQQERRHFAGLLSLTFNDLDAEAVSQAASWDKSIKALEQSNPEDSAWARFALFVSATIATITVDSLEQLSPAVDLVPEADYSIMDNPALAIAQIVTAAQTSQSLWAASFLAGMAASLSGDLGILADTLMQGLKTSGKVDPAALAQLLEIGLHGHMPKGAPKKTDTIALYLEMRQAEINSNLARYTFAHDNGYEDKTLQRAETLYNAIDALAHYRGNGH